MTDEGRLLKSGQVAELFDVTPQTPYRWAKDGKLPKDAFVITPSGRYMFRESVIRAILDEGKSHDEASE